MWFLPSFGRPARAQATLDSMVAAGLSTPGLLFVDGDPDPAYDRIRLPDGWQMLRAADNQGVCAAFNRFLADRPGLPWYGFMSDDSIVRTADFDRLLLAAAGPWAITHSADGWRNDSRIHGAVVFGGALLRALGWWALPGLRHAYCDDVWEYLADRLRCRRYCAEVLVEHHHVDNGKAPSDPTYRLAYATERDDAARFQHWMLNEAADCLRGLLAAIGREVEAEQVVRAGRTTEDYQILLGRLHGQVKPRRYLEIGVRHGDTLALALPDTEAQGVDPDPRIPDPALAAKVVRMTSDAYFAAGRCPGELDLAFIDGLHHFDQVLNDIANVAARGSPRLVVALHDSMPRNAGTAGRELTDEHWTGDVWKALAVLEGVDPAPQWRHVATAPSGLSIAEAVPDRLVASDDAIAAWRHLGLDFLPIALRAFLDTPLRRLPTVGPDLAGVRLVIASPCEQGAVSEPYHRALLASLPALHLCGGLVRVLHRPSASLPPIDGDWSSGLAEWIAALGPELADATHLAVIPPDLDWVPDSLPRLITLTGAAQIAIPSIRTGAQPPPLLLLRRDACDQLAGVAAPTLASLTVTQDPTVRWQRQGDRWQVIAR